MTSRPIYHSLKSCQGSLRNGREDLLLARYKHALLVRNVSTHKITENEVGQHAFHLVQVYICLLYSGAGIEGAK